MRCDVSLQHLLLFLIVPSRYAHHNLRNETFIIPVLTIPVYHIHGVKFFTKICRETLPRNTVVPDPSPPYVVAPKLVIRSFILISFDT